MLEKTTPIKTGTGEKSSTNYHPTFKIVGWAPRGDLAPQSKVMTNGSGQTAPATGGTRAAAPQQAATVAPGDFG
jgi:hypothetical protein